jgi:hypothetical protein
VKDHANSTPRSESTDAAEVPAKELFDLLPERSARTAQGNAIRDKYAKIEPGELEDEKVVVRRLQFWQRRPIIHFVGSLVAEYGYRVAIFLHQLREMCATKLGQYKHAREWQTARVFGAAQDISERQFRRIARDAVKTGYVTLDHEVRDGVSLLLFTCDRRLAKLVDDEKEAKGKANAFFFDARIARHVSIDAALIYPIIRRETMDEVQMAIKALESGQHRNYAGVPVWTKSVQRVYPWMTRFVILHALRDLVRVGLILRNENTRSTKVGKLNFVYRIPDRDAFKTLDQIAAELDAKSDDPIHLDGPDNPIGNREDEAV